MRGNVITVCQELEIPRDYKTLGKDKKETREVKSGICQMSEDWPMHGQNYMIWDSKG